MTGTLIRGREVGVRGLAPAGSHGVPMTPLEAIILGIVQGLSEFLPISSTAHLTIAGRMVGAIDDSRPHEWTAFIAVTQLGTLVAVLAYFRDDLLRMAKAVVTPGGDRAARKLAWLVVLGSLPIGLAGLLLRDVIEGPLTKDLRVIAATLILLAIVLAVADRVGKRERGIDQLDTRTALAVGGFQVLSLIPGASRAGTTLTGALFAGLDRESAARFSFLLSIPAIGASGLLELPLVAGATTFGLPALVLAVVAAAISGYASIWFLLRYLQTRDLTVFVVYRIVLGIAILAWLVLPL
jgi:undecaprenyl-diphosphatase